MGPGDLQHHHDQADEAREEEATVETSHERPW